MAAAVEVFKQALIAKRPAMRRRRRKPTPKARRAAHLDAVVHRFETEVSGLTQALAGAATELEATAQSR